MNPEEFINQSVLILAQLGLSGTSKPLGSIEPDNWIIIRNKAQNQTIQGIVFDGLQFIEKENLPPKNILIPWLIEIENIEKANKKQIETITKLQSLFQDNSIQIKILKGQGIANLYPTPIHRICGDIDLWFKKYSFDEQVMIALFDYCYNRGAMHRNYIQTVAEAWASNKVQTWNDLDKYYQKQENLNKFKKTIAKKLGKYNGLTQYEEAYIENWVLNFGYNMDVIEIALKRTTLKQNPTFEYINTTISDWHERNLTTPAEITAFIDQRKKQVRETKELQSQVSKANYDQRKYDNLDFLYANNLKKED